MQARALIMDLYETGQIRKTCRQVLPTLADDLEQEVMLTLLEKPESKIVAAHQGGYFLWYVVRIILNLARSKNASMHRQYRHLDPIEELNQDLPEESHYDTDIEAQFQAAQDEMNSWAEAGQYPYDKNLFELHLQIRTKKELSRRTGIPYRSVCYTIDNAKEKIKSKLNGTATYHNPIIARCLRYRVYASDARSVLPIPRFQALQLRDVPCFLAGADRHVHSPRYTRSSSGNGFDSGGK